MTTPTEKVTVTVDWAMVLTAPPGAEVRVDHRWLNEYALRLTVAGKSLEEADSSMAALKTELRRVLDL